MKKQLPSLILCFCVFVLTVVLYYFGTLDSWQEKMIDRFFLKHEPEEHIVIVAIDDQSLNALGQWPWPRSTFATFLDKVESARIVGFDINFADNSSLGPKDDQSFRDAIKNSKAPVVLPFELRRDGAVSVKSLDMFEVYASSGFVNMIEDRDGVVRRANTQSGSYKSFSSVISGSSTVLARERINFRGPAGTFLTIPFIDVYEGKVPARIFDDATVLVGVTANNLHDFFQTPFGQIPGVEVNANIIETVREGVFPKDMPFSGGIALIALFNMLGATLILRVKKLGYLIAGLAGIFLAIGIVSFALFYFYIVLPVLYVLVGFLLTSATTLIFSYATESKEKRFIRKSFQYYLSGDVIEDIVEHPEKLNLGGEKRNMTILFSDVRDFTTISESMTPEKLTAFMSHYFTGTSDIVMQRRGIIDKYIGDAIMAFWGAPLDNSHHAEDACRVALLMIQNTNKDNEDRVAQGLPAIHIGIGINSGDVVVGNMGSKTRFNYTCVGDDVNFTSRLEGLTKQYGITCIISESTAEKIKGIKELYARELDDVLVKGKKQPKKIFELMDTPVDPTTLLKLEHFKSGRDAYVKGNFTEAIEAFEKAYALDGDKPSRIFIERCKSLMLNPPEHWSGVFEFKTK